MASLASRLDGGSDILNSRASGGAGRAGKQRQGQTRPAPYSRSSSSTSKPATPTSGSTFAAPNTSAGSTSGLVDGDKWEHDLFNPLSDLYRPQLNSNFGRSGSGNASADGRSSRGPRGSGVFGKAMQGLGSASSSSRPQATRRASGSASMDVDMVTSPVASTSSSSRQPQYAANDLFGSLGVNGITGNTGGAVQLQNSTSHSDERRARQRQIADMEEQALQRERDRKLANQAAQRQAAEEEDAKRRAILESLDNDRNYVSRQQEEEAERERAKKTASSTCVLIQNLVDGTTPEDVKAALSDYGEILSCVIKESTGEVVSMLVDFSQRKEAIEAVNKLDGALADGRTLRLSIVDKPKSSMSIRNTAPQQARNGTGAHASTSRAQDIRPAQQPTAPKQNAVAPMPVAAPASKLRSESLVQLDPRATTMTEPVHQRVGRDNPSNGRTTKEASLAGRLGQPVTNSRSQPAVGRRQLAAGGGSLFERLGKPAGGRAGNDAMDLN